MKGTRIHFTWTLIALSACVIAIWGAFAFYRESATRWSLQGDIYDQHVFHGTRFDVQIVAQHPRQTGLGHVAGRCDFSSRSKGTDNWVVIASVVLRESQRIQRDCVQEVDESRAFFYCNYLIGVTRDGGSSWHTWMLSDVGPLQQHLDPQLVEDAKVIDMSMTKEGVIHIAIALYPLADGADVSRLELRSEDDGRTWIVESP